jgi:hypothetical protein
MGRHKKENPLSESVLIRMDRKLRVQLEKQAGGKGNISKVARKAIKLFLNENK